jgi:hypothetical protein
LRDEGAIFEEMIPKKWSKGRRDGAARIRRAGDQMR